MKVVVRPLESTDLPGIAKLRARLRALVFPDKPDAYDNDRHSSIWRWLETHPLADEMHRWVLVTEDGDLLGHLAAVPQYYRIDGQRVVAHTPTDYQVLPGYGFHALSLMRKFFRTSQNCVACDRWQEVIKVETRMGAEVAGELQFMVKLWDVSQLSNLSPSIPIPVLRLLNRGLRAVDKALSSILLREKLRVEVLEGFDRSFDELFEEIATSVPCLLEKDSAFLRWRYGPGSPQAPVTLLGVREKGRLLGYAVLWVSGGQNGYLLDLTTLPGRRDVARALLRAAVDHCRRARLRTIRYRFLESSTSARLKDLWRLGLFPAGGRRSMLLVKFEDRSLHELANDTAHWSYSIGDGEASFWDYR